MASIHSFITIRNIQLLIDSNDPIKRDQYYKKLFEWQDLVYRSANLVLSHQFVMDNLKEIPYLSDGVKVRLADENVDPAGILNTSKINTTYRLLSTYFKGRVPTNILSCINHSLVKTFNLEKQHYWTGARSLRNYKKDMPIPFTANSLKLKHHDVYKEFKINLFDVPFRTYLGKDRSDKHLVLKQAMAGKVKICTSALQIIKGKLFLKLALEIPKVEIVLKTHNIIEASLGIEHPITVIFGKESYSIGTKEEFLYRRIAIQSARNRAQKAAAFNCGGHGRKRKLKNLLQFEEKEKNFVESRLHLYSRMLIDICIKHNAGTLLLCGQTEKKDLAQEDAFLLRNWSYFSLLEKIKYKANRLGIGVIVE